MQGIPEKYTSCSVETQPIDRHVLRYKNQISQGHTVYSRAVRVFIVQHYFSSQSFAAVREAFSNAYPDREVSLLDETALHRLVTRFRLHSCLPEGRDTFSICCKTSPLVSPNKYK
jgi:hypothetical protein